MGAKAKYKFKFGFFGKKDAKVVAEFLEEKFPDGTIRAHDVLEVARPKNSPIHHYFEWDDSKAAEKFRLHQASRMIQSLVVVVDDVETRKYTRPVKVEWAKEKRCVDVDVARQSKDIWDQVVARAMRDALLWRERYQNISQLKPISRAITQTEKELIKKGLEL